MNAVRRLRVVAPAGARHRGSRATVHVSGLAPRERWTVRLGTEVVDRGRATRRGLATASRSRCPDGCAPTTSARSAPRRLGPVATPSAWCDDRSTPRVGPRCGADQHRSGDGPDPARRRGVRVLPAGRRRHRRRGPRQPRRGYVGRLRPGRCEHVGLHRRTPRGLPDHVRRPPAGLRVPGRGTAGRVTGGLWQHAAGHAYWGLFWSDGRSGTWTYASVGVGSLRVPAGGFIGWRFQDGGARSAPGVTPCLRAPPRRRPGPSRRRPSRPAQAVSVADPQVQRRAEAHEHASGQPEATRCASSSPKAPRPSPRPPRRARLRRSARRHGGRPPRSKKPAARTTALGQPHRR